VRARLGLFAFLDEVGPLITLHTLWFADHGVSASEISAVFVLWAAVGVVLEVPSGAVADRVDRRRLIAGAVALRAVGIAVWMVWPTVAGLAVGAVLWAVHSAFASGAWEALIHDQLAAVGQEDDYARTHARVEQASTAGIFVGTVAALAGLQLGASLLVLGWVTVALHGPSLLLMATLPAVPRVDDDEALTLASWWRTLRRGVHEVTHTPVTGRLVGVGALLGGLFLVDEYVPLLGRVRKASDAEATALVLVVWLGGLAGSEVAARFDRLPSRSVGALLLGGLGVACLGLGAGPWWMLPLLAVGYGAQFVAHLHSDARLQERLDSAHRATATSVRELLSNGISMGVLVIVGWLSVGDDPTAGLWVMLAGIAASAVLLIRWVPDPAPIAEGTP